MRTKLIMLAIFVLLVAFAAPPSGAEGKDIAPNGKGVGTLQHPPQSNAVSNGAKPGGAAAGNGIFYHGGPLILGTTNAYYIWYGNWSGADPNAKIVLPDLASNIAPSAYYNINTTYTDGSGAKVTNTVALAGQTDDNYSRGTSLTDGDIQAIVAAAINGGRLPKDTNGVYFVLTTPDVNETSGFCTQYCAWHTHGTIAGSDIKYAFIGDTARCPSACQAQATGPNGGGGADGMANTIAHELEEAVTDPDLNAWFDRRGFENADKCAWTFGATYTANGAQANMKLGTRDYLIQQNWVNASGGFCALSFP